MYNRTYPAQQCYDNIHILHWSVWFVFTCPFVPFWHLILPSRRMCTHTKRKQKIRPCARRLLYPRPDR